MESFEDDSEDDNEPEEFEEPSSTPFDENFEYAAPKVSRCWRSCAHHRAPTMACSVAVL